MKCPHCNKEIEAPEQKSAFGWMLPNIVVPVVFVFWILQWLFPFNVEHSYNVNYDMLILFVLVIIYFVYLQLYNLGKVKGTFVLVKKNA